jgi:GAF domain-containing protein
VVIGTIQVFEQDRSFFGNEELNLLEVICTDISFALATIEAEEQREITRRALAESEEKFRILVEEWRLYHPESPFSPCQPEVCADHGACTGRYRWIAPGQ